MEPVDSVAVYGNSCYKGLWEISIRKQQHMESQQKTELFRKWPEIYYKYTVLISGMVYGNMTSLEPRESIYENYDPFLNGFRDEKKYRLVVNILSLMPYSISICVWLPTKPDIRWAYLSVQLANSHLI